MRQIDERTLGICTPVAPPLHRLQGYLSKLNSFNVQGQITTGSLYKPFTIHNCLRHRCVLSCTLFNLILKKVIRDAGYVYSDPQPGSEKLVTLVRKAVGHPSVSGSAGVPVVRVKCEPVKWVEEVRLPGV